jgi:hypothetical protein
LTAPTIECKNSSASEAPNPGRHHVGTPGDIISECPGDFVGIRTLLNHIPALASAFFGGVLLYLSIYLPVQSIIFPTILAGVGTMALAYSYGTLRQMTR